MARTQGIMGQSKSVEMGKPDLNHSLVELSHSAKSDTTVQCHLMVSERQVDGRTMIAPIL